MVALPWRARNVGSFRGVFKKQKTRFYKRESEVLLLGLKKKKTRQSECMKAKRSRPPAPQLVGSVLACVPGFVCSARGWWRRYRPQPPARCKSLGLLEYQKGS